MLERWKNAESRARVDRMFHVPMLILAFLILPLLALDLFARDRLPRGGGLFVELGYALIWLAFLAEFVIKISIAESKWQYVRKNWLDIIVIIAPMLRPLRALRIARAARVGSAIQSARLLTLRAIAQKALKTAFYLIAEYRALRKVTKSGASVTKTRRKGASELDALREQVSSLQDRLTALETRLDELSARVEQALEGDETSISRPTGPRAQR